MIAAVIQTVEALFWVLVLGGLTARYLLRMRRLSTVMLLLVPLLDVVLLTVIAVHLSQGASADVTHGLGALYLGFTVAYGHSVITWADVRFAHRFAGGPSPPPRPTARAARLRHENVAWLRGLLACLIGAGALAGLTLFVGDPERTAVLDGFYTPLGIFMFWNTVIAVWGVVSALFSAEDGSPAPPVPASVHTDARG
ncbi:hypothetical protein CDO52_14090 [Nocardiopsis gilva YIM 90087]|uniref:Uncharacterized protein n=1 Tax=Nocardiopsis gilva YIM 90087 TaxID=1235441 RepID=A0A223S6P1_9ACTN|nr:hypothetical protein [Nocardiopsis gilva]ASU83762.1 hypothetical protein CDO52_14090 [Nocardiopsis gilva YIM 90087]